ncbi:unnamed protein product [Discosporangium mesarthrocarpum]
MSSLVVSGLPALVNGRYTLAKAFAALPRMLKRGAKWSVEREPHTMPVPLDIIDEAKIESLLLSTRDSARDPLRIRDILLNARRRATLKHVSRSKLGSSEYVQGLTLEVT